MITSSYEQVDESANNILKASCLVLDIVGSRTEKNKSRRITRQQESYFLVD